MENILKENEAKQLETLITWASVAYTGGFFTVMVHTSRLGIPVIELIKPVYIWIGLPLAIVAFSTRWIYKAAKSRYATLKLELENITKGVVKTLKDQGIETENSGAKELADPLIDGVIAISSILPLGIILSHVYGELGNVIGLVIQTILENYLKVPRFRYFAEKWFSIFGYFAKAFESINRFLSFATIISLIPIGCFVYIFYLYPIIPQSVGGGKPANVVLFVNSEKIPHDLSYVRELFPNGTDWADSTIATVELELYYTTDTSYFVSKLNSAVVSLNKGAIEGIIWQDSGLFTKENASSDSTTHLP